jgi:hypothetical protein
VPLAVAGPRAGARGRAVAAGGLGAGGGGAVGVDRCHGNDFTPELLVDGGAPARVPLGRRAAWGFHPDAVGDGGVARVSSYVDAYGEYAEVTRDDATPIPNTGGLCVLPRPR